MENVQTIPRELPESLWAAWAEFVNAETGIMLDEKKIASFKALLKELVEWNEKMNLVSIRSAEEVLWRHFADSLMGLKPIIKHGAEHGTRVIDIGAGAGFPGLPVKLAMPEINISLLESITKKCTFIEHAAAVLGISGLRVVNDRAEVKGRETAFRGAFDYVLSRAVAKFPPNLEIGIPLLKKGGKMILYKTENSLSGPEGLDSVKNALKVLGAKCVENMPYSIPGQELKYCILVIEKLHDTPEQYPRRTGIPEKKPL